MKNQSESRDIKPIRILAGAFLLYLSWKLLSGVIYNNPSSNNGTPVNVPLSIIFCVLFFLAGGTLVFIEIRAYISYTREVKKKKAAEAFSEPAEQIEDKTGDPE